MSKREGREKEKESRYRPEDINLGWLKDVDKAKPKKERRR